MDPSLLALLVVAELAAILALAVWAALLQRKQSQMRRRLRAVFDGGTDGLDEVLDRLLRRGEEHEKRVEVLAALHRELASLSQRSVQKVGLVRFNPFHDTGGDQSFAIALLDGEGTGVVLSSLHSRTETRIFAKEVAGGRSKHSLSDEEQQAIKSALTPAR